MVSFIAHVDVRRNVTVARNCLKLSNFVAFYGELCRKWLTKWSCYWNLSCGYSLLEVFSSQPHLTFGRPISWLGDNTIHIAVVIGANVKQTGCPTSFTALEHRYRREDATSARCSHFIPIVFGVGRQKVHLMRFH